MQHALHQTFSAATAVLVGASDATRRRQVLGDCWRENLRRIEDHLTFIPQHLRTIANGEGQRLTQKQKRYVAYCRDRLAERLPKYLACVRRVSEAEAEMDRIGMAYARSSDAWPVEIPALSVAA